MTIGRLVTVLAHHWLFVGALTAAMVGAAALITFRSPDRYRASALIQVQTPVDSTGAISLNDTLTSRERAVTIAALGNTRDVAVRAAKRVPGNDSACSVSQQGQSEFLLATCTGGDRSAVARAANAYAAALQGLLETQRAARITELNRQYRAQIAVLRAQGVPAANYPTPPIYPNYRELEIIDSARPPATPYAPRPVRTLALALVLGLLLNSALAFLLEHVQNRARSTEELQRELGEPILAAIPVLRHVRRSVTPPIPSQVASAARRPVHLRERA